MNVDELLEDFEFWLKSAIIMENVFSFIIEGGPTEQHAASTKYNRRIIGRGNKVQQNLRDVYTFRSHGKRYSKVTECTFRESKLMK